MLTGESVPIIKAPLPNSNDEYDPTTDQKHTLFGGTKVLLIKHEGDQKTIALVSRTGFTTEKGNLVRDILYPRHHEFKFYRDSLFFIGFMFIVAIIGYSSTFKFLTENGVSKEDKTYRFFDMVTVAVPPILPIAITFASIYALFRLKFKKIYCVSPPRINVAGRVNYMVFDKTGTLTEDDLQIYGYRIVDDI